MTLATITWTGAATGFWDVTTNWSSTPALPGPIDTVTIDVAGTGTITHRSGINTVVSLAIPGLNGGTGNLAVTGGELTVTGTYAGTAYTSISGSGTLVLSGPSTLNTLTLSAGRLAGAGTVVVSGLSAFSGGMQSGAGTTVAQGGAVLTGTAGSLDGGRVLELQGNSTIEGPEFTFDLNGADPVTTLSEPGSGILRVAQGALLDDQTIGGGFTMFATSRVDPDFGADALFDVRGTFRRSGTSSQTYLFNRVSNTGTIDVRTGALDLDQVTVNSGTFLVAAGALLRVYSSFVSGGTLTGGSYILTANGTADARFGLAATGLVSNAATILLDGSLAAMFDNQTPANDALLTFAANAAAGAFTIQNGNNFTAAGGFANAGGVQIGPSSAFTTAGTFTNTGSARLRGGTLAAAVLTNALDLNGFGLVSPAVANTGTVRAAGGALTLSNGVTGTAGLVQIDADGSLSLGAASTAGTLAHNGGVLALGANAITVSGDYTNAGFGSGNAFNRRANVSGSGQILAAGGVTARQTLSGDTGATTTGDAVLAMGNIHVGSNVSKLFQTGNIAAAGPTLRVALQTAANGGNITDSRLTGSGVSEGANATLAPGASIDRTVTFNGTGAGALTGQSVRILNNFDNTNSQTVSVTGAAYRFAAPNAHTPEPVTFANRHVGDGASQILTIGNIVPADGFSEALDATIGGATTGITAAGSFSLLAAGATNAAALAVGLDTATAGLKSGTATIALTSDGTGTSGLGLTVLAAQTVAVSGSVWRLAAASAHTPQPVAFGSRHVGDVVSQALTLQNTAAGDGFSENLNALAAGATAGITASGAFTGLAAQATNNSALTVGLNTAAAGLKSGTATISLTSDGTGTSGLGLTTLPDQTVDVSGTVYRLAAASAHTPEPVVFANRHVGDAASQTLTLQNTAAADGFSEALNAAASNAAAGITASGSFTGLAAQGTNNSALTVGLNTATAGAKSGTATIALTSDGTGTSGLGLTGIGTQTVAVSGNVFRLATASAHTPEPVAFGNVHVGDAASQTLMLQNTAAADGFSEALNAAAGNAAAGITASGSFTGLAAQGTNNSALTVGLNTATAGAKSGTATITLTSDGAGTSGLGLTGIGTQTVDVSGTVYRLATASAHTPEPVVFANRHVGDAASQTLTLQNTAAADGFSEALNAAASNAAAGITASGSFTGLAAQGTNNSALTVGLNTATAGAKSGTATIALTSDGTGTSGLGLTGIGTQTVAVSGNVFRLATASAHSPEPVAFGNVHVGDSVSRALTLQNTAAADGFSEALNATIGGATTGITAAGSFTGLAAQASNNSALSVGLNTAARGIKSGTATIGLTSDGTGTSALGLTGIGTQTAAVSGTVFALAAPSVTTVLNFGAARVGDAPIGLGATLNNGLAGGFQESLGYQIGAVNPAGGFGINGATDGTIAAGTSASLTFDLTTGTAGDFTGAAAGLGLTSLGTGTSGLADTALSGQTITLNGKVYATAIAQTGTAAVNFGFVHAGDASSRNVTVTNTATGALTDVLIGAFGTISPGFTGSGSLGAGLTAAATGTLTVSLDTSIARILSGTAGFALFSRDTDLADVAVSHSPLNLSGTVNNFAIAAIEQSSGPGTFGVAGLAYTLDFGIVTIGTGTLTASLAVRNAAAGPADVLGGSFAVSGSGFGLAGFDPFSALAAGSAFGGLSVSLNPSTLGVFTQTVTLSATGANASGFSGALAPETLTITGTVACFAAGTRIATEDGPVAVENLAAGDRLVTRLGGDGRIVWIGQRTVDCARHPNPELVWPVRVKREAFGKATPARDLYLSPDHAIYIDDVLIPVRHLVNGTTIRQTKRKTVTYFHVELPLHSVILAEGLTTESYLDTGDRARFINGAAVATLHPDFSARAWEMKGCAELVQTGPALERIRRRLAAAAISRGGDRPFRHRLAHGTAAEQLVHRLTEVA
ncbi:MAG: Hint domain-containing protein [Acetobacteraceae bacterium]|nr:Hint domain-containing protein [Acetobacteraceae bacterium]